MRVVLITGCRSGIGRATALGFARAGDAVHATMRDPTDGEELVDVAKREGLSIEVRALDVTDGHAIDDVTRAVLATHGRIDVLVNNAGVPGPLAALEEVDEAQARRAVETNFWAPFRLTRAVLPHMRAAGGGVIVNISTFGVRLAPGTRGLFFYNMTKRALYQLSLSLEAELEGTGVRVIDIEPGAFATGIYDDSKRPVIDATSPYAPMLITMDRVLAGMIANGAPPEIVASAIVEAVDDPESPTCVLVGEDAIAAVTEYEQAQVADWARRNRS
jgi:NAD(P)-dependent dehydrogenase (short-subunit alcohol dehydrogenase family)